MDRQEILAGSYDEISTELVKGKSLDYPCAVLSGVITQEELEMLRDREDVYSYNKYDEEGEDVEVKVETCPLYVEFEGKTKRIGTFYFSLQYILSLKYVGDYKLKLYANEELFRDIDLSNGNDLLAFIQL